MRPRAKGHWNPKRLGQAGRPHDTWISEVWPKNQGHGRPRPPTRLGQACERNGQRRTARALGALGALGGRCGGRP